MSDFHDQRAIELLKSNLYLVVGSASAQGKPWSSPVYFSIDEALNLYWTSDKQSQHSQNIRENKDVFLVVYNSSAPVGKFIGEGLYIEAEATELNDPHEVQAARQITQGRKGGTGEEEYKRFTNEAVRRVYKAIPKHVWINDVENDEAGNYIRDVRVDVSLKALGGLLLAEK